MSHVPFSQQLSAMIDGELQPGGMAALTDHLVSCPGCVRHLGELAALRVALYDEIPEEDVSPEFYEKISSLLDQQASAPLPIAVPGDAHNIIELKSRRTRLRVRNLMRRDGGWIAAVTAVAAMLMVLLLPYHDVTRDFMSVRDAALRGDVLQTAAGNLTGPTVVGFRLASARPDIVAGRQAQVFGYTRANQTVTLCVCPADGEPAHSVRHAVYKGMTIGYWNDGKQQYWVATLGSAATLNGFLAAMKVT